MTTPDEFAKAGLNSADSEPIVGKQEAGQKKGASRKLAGFVSTSRHCSSLPEAIQNEIRLNPSPFTETYPAFLAQATVSE
jgi:hypothetical protein